MAQDLVLDVVGALIGCSRDRAHPDLLKTRRDAVFDGAVPAKTRSAGCAVNAAASIARDASVASPRPHRSRGTR